MVLEPDTPNPTDRALTCQQPIHESHLVHQLLGALTTGAFALALVFLSRDDGDRAADAMLMFALAFAAVYVVTLVLEDSIAE